MRGRAADEPEHLMEGYLPVPITPENYKFLEKEAKRRGNISIEEGFNQIMKEDMMRMLNYHM